MFLRFIKLALPIILCAEAAAQDLPRASRDFRAFLTEYRCEVVNRLERIYGFGDRSQERDRFIAITVPEHRHGYVQCMFYENGRKLLCEASSGFHLSKPDEPRVYRLPEEKIDKLKVLGFSDNDSAGNFRRYMDVAAPPNFNRIADFLLAALYEGYDANPRTRLRFNAPFARGKATTCIPVG